MRAITRADHEAELEQLGLTGGALEAAVGALGRVRHQYRVVAAQEAAMQAAGGNRMAAAAILLSDGHIRQTDRHPALAGLGKGRRKATDGPAWSAAIFAAGCALAERNPYRWHATQQGRVMFGDADVTELIPPWVRVQVCGGQLATAVDGANPVYCSQWGAAYNASLEQGGLQPHKADMRLLRQPHRRGAPLPDACAPVEDVFSDD